MIIITRHMSPYCPRGLLLTLGQGSLRAYQIFPAAARSRNCASLSLAVQLYSDNTDLYTVYCVSQPTIIVTIIARVTLLHTCQKLTECSVPLLLGGVDPLNQLGTLLGHVSCLAPLGQLTLTGATACSLGLAGCDILTSSGVTR